MGDSTGGNWTPEEAAHHITYLEMLATSFSLKAFITIIVNKHVKLMIDNTVVVACINTMGTFHSRLINSLVKDLWTMQTNYVLIIMFALLQLIFHEN